MHDMIEELACLRRELDALRPDGAASPPIDLQRQQDVELTYSSNAIEGNTLTHSETAELIEHGISASGKPIKDHYEALDHYDALQWMRSRAATRDPLDDNVVLELHRLTMRQSRPDIAGTYAQFGRRLSGSPVTVPNPLKVPAMMEDFGKSLADADSSPETAFDRHYRLVAIHPFDDGNGRTARLLTNLMLLREGWTPISVRPEQRRAYLDALKDNQTKQDDAAPAFQHLMHACLAEAMRDYIQMLTGELSPTQHRREPGCPR